MPPEQHHYCDWWYDDLPDSARKAAAVLGWTKETWDHDEEVPYQHQSWKECTANEKVAAQFLGLAPLESSMMNVWWEDLDEETQKQAAILTYTQELWDDDYDLEDLPCDSWYWKDMTEEQRKAANFFGYTRVTWDQTGEDLFETVDGVDVEVPTASSASTNETKTEAGAPKKKLGVKKQQQQTGNDGEKKDSQFAVSRFYGGATGTPFDHRNHRFMESVEVFTHGKIIDGIKATYCNHQTYSSGTLSGKAHKLTLEPGEYIDRVEIREDKVVQELTFHTNKGKVHGPWGGHGRLLLTKDKKGTVQDVTAPAGKCLCGFMGRQSKLIDALALRWGPTDTVPSA